MDKNEIFFKFTDYIWKYFELHANQRIMPFKFYIGFCGLFISAIGYLSLKFPPNNFISEVFLLIISAFLIIITCVFYGLDNRNRQLIKYAESSLRHLEEKIESNITPIPSICLNEIKIFTKEKKEKENGNSCIGHTALFRFLFCFTGIIGIIFLMLSLLKLGVIAWLCHYLSTI